MCCHVSPQAIYSVLCGPPRLTWGGSVRDVKIEGGPGTPDTDLVVAPYLCSGSPSSLCSVLHCAHNS